MRYYYILDRYDSTEHRVTDAGGMLRIANHQITLCVLTYRLYVVVWHAACTCRKLSLQRESRTDRYLSREKTVLKENYPPAGIMDDEILPRS
jgi:hypothetical protein